MSSNKQNPSVTLKKKKKKKEPVARVCFNATHLSSD